MCHVPLPPSLSPSLLSVGADGCRDPRHAPRGPASAETTTGELPDRNQETQEGICECGRGEGDWEGGKGSVGGGRGVWEGEGDWEGEGRGVWEG